MRFSFSYISTVLLLPVLLAGCSKGPVSEPAPRELTVLIGTDGYGDGSYNDTMLEGILGFCKDHPDVTSSSRRALPMQGNGWTRGSRRRGAGTAPLSLSATRTRIS